MKTLTSTATIDNMTVSLDDIIDILAIDSTSVVLEDPHFIGFNGEQYDFMGENGKIYNLYTSGTMQINARLEEFLPKKTYMNAIGIKVGNKEVGVQEISIEITPEGIRSFYNRKPANRFEYQEVFNFNTGLKEENGTPIYGWAVANIEDKWLNIQTGSLNATIYYGEEMYEEHTCPHLNLSIKPTEIGLISDGVAPHGILGITASCLKARQCTGPDAQGIIDGKPKDYLVENLFSSDFKYNRFGVEPNTEKLFGFRRSSRSDVIE